MTESEAIQEMKAMSDEELLMVPFDVVKWICAGKGCCRGTKVRDYGIAPEFFHPRKSISWFSVRTSYFMCEKHYKMYKRLKKNFTQEHIENRLFDFNKIKIQKL